METGADDARILLQRAVECLPNGELFSYQRFLNVPMNRELTRLRLIRPLQILQKQMQNLNKN